MNKPPKNWLFKANVENKIKVLKVEEKLNFLYQNIPKDSIDLFFKYKLPVGGILIKISQKVMLKMLLKKL